MRQDKYSQYRKTSQPAPMPGADDFEDFARKPKPVDDDAGSDALYGVPKLALLVICGNFVLWSCGLVSYWMGRVSLINIVSGMTLLVIMFAIWLVIAYIQWRFFWWLLALSTSLATLALGYIFILLLTGQAALTDIHLPRIVF